MELSAKCKKRIAYWTTFHIFDYLFTLDLPRVQIILFTIFTKRLDVVGINAYNSLKYGRFCEYKNNGDCGAG